MAMLPNVFKAEDNRDSGFEPIPEGWYIGEFTKSELKATKANAANKYLALTFKITDGEYAKRYLFDNLNLIHTNPQAVTIAQGKLASICDACGVTEIEDSAELHGIEIGVRVIIKEGTAQHPAPRNEIKSYKAIDDIPDDDDDDEEGPF